jgi:hypothetical protein
VPSGTPWVQLFLMPSSSRMKMANLGQLSWVEKWLGSTSCVVFNMVVVLLSEGECIVAREK